ncbi:MAG TPA: TatD family hydrolase [Dongiaceae bacterium]|nr:TatD family hydrolase [Dongiaceae bacterium]
MSVASHSTAVSPFPLVDSHCHLDKLDLAPYDGDLTAALQAALNRGVHHVVCIGIDLENIAGVLAIAQQFPAVSASVGVHPLYRESREPTLAELVQFGGHEKVIAIGETGLDYFYGEGDLQWQRDRFLIHIEAARQTDLPLIIHSRGAKEDTLAFLRDTGQGSVRGVMHCFTEDLDMAKRAIDLGFLISISGIVTFRNADELRAVVKALPLDRLLVETDAPWLAPIPYRGKSNEPRFVVEVAQKVAEIKGVTLDDVARQTTDNFFNLFPRAVRA